MMLHLPGIVAWLTVVKIDLGYSLEISQVTQFGLGEVAQPVFLGEVTGWM